MRSIAWDTEPESIVDVTSLSSRSSPRIEMHSFGYDIFRIIFLLSLLKPSYFRWFAVALRLSEEHENGTVKNEKTIGERNDDKMKSRPCSEHFYI